MAIDFTRTLKDLYAEKERIERVIVSLEALQDGSHVAADQVKKSRRGRKSMGVEERREVSERMRKYWENRRHELHRAAS
jgi:hypothetical protein